MKLFLRLSLLIFIAFCGSFSAKALTANFTASPVAGCTPLVVSFTNTSTGSTSWKWDFDNGDPPAYVFDAGTTFINPFPYTITFTVTLTAYNGTDSARHSVVITVYPLPRASFTASATSVCPGIPVTFTSTTVGGVPGPVTCAWNFGDGSGGTGSPVSHSFAASGNYNITLSATNAEGCHSDTTITAYIHVYTLPSPSFTIDSTTLCGTPAHVDFTSSVIGTGPYTYNWSFGDGTPPSTATNPAHTYATGGTYDVRLIVTDGHGCIDTININETLTIVPPIVASFLFPDTACVFSAVTFTNTTSSSTSNYWTFGDGHSSFASTGVNVYGTSGLKTVTLAAGNGPCHDTISHETYIRPGPIASFTQTPAHPCPPPVALTFNATVPSGATVNWIYGDGLTGSGASVTHNYGSRGVYNVKMIVFDPATGCQDTVIKIDTLYDLYLAIIDTPDSGCAPLTVHFSDSLYTFEPPPVTDARKHYPWGIASYSWNFGDGFTSALSNPTHTYTDTGTYYAVLTATTTNGCVVSDTVKIKVGNGPDVVIRAADTTLCFGFGNTYYDSVITGPVGYYVWYWGYGIPDTSLGGSVGFGDTLPGIYTVTMTPFYNGCPGVSRTVRIHVTGPMAIIRDSVFCSPATEVAFWDDSWGDNSHTWIFGDGTTSTLSNPIHNYASLSTYTVTLATGNDTSGCRDTTRLVVSLAKPQPHFVAQDTTLCLGVPDTLTSSVTGGSASSYFWYVNGVFESSFSRLSYVFPDTGYYSVKLVIIDNNHCSDTFSRTNYVFVAHPYVRFTESPTSGCVPLPVTLTDHTTDAHGITFTNYRWSFGDGFGLSGLSSTVSHTYTASGIFVTKDVVTDNFGCKDSVTHFDTVILPNASFTGVSLHPCVGVPVVFTNTSTGFTTSEWFFGDGGTSTLTNPTHAYSAPGLYTVRLVVTDSHGCSDTATDSNYIDVTRPVASFTMDDSFAICPPLTVHFTNTSTGAVRYNWWLGDGSTSVFTNPSDFYIAVGNYTVTLVATNIYGCTDTAIGHAVIFGYAGALSYGPDSGCVPLTVHFFASLSNVPSIVWDFSDGTTDSASYSDTISHTYVLPGAFVPRLIISDNTGCAASSIGLDTIKVDAVTPGFTTVPDPICQNGTINFKDTSKGYWDPVDSWLWTFTNGDTSTSPDPPYTYTAVGIYPVTLFVTDRWGCTASVTENVVVYPPAVITVSPDTIVCLGDAATLTGYGGVKYWWSPSSTVSCSPCNPTEASPTVATTYTVTGQDVHGCLNTDTVRVSLKNATFSVGKGDTAICKGVTVQLFDSGATHFRWNPASGLSSAIIANPLASPASTTVYTVVAQLGDCIPDTNYIRVIVYPLPTVDAGPDQTLVAGSVAQLQASGTNVSYYMWDRDPTLSCDSCSDPVASMSVTTTYVVNATSPHQCKASDSVTIHLVCEQDQIWLPNAFTPNGDGQDDIFYIRGKGISSIKTFRIYNRWGNLLFERENININDPTNGWDGTYKDATPHPDVYVYVIEAICDLGTQIFVKGDVTIIR